MALLRKMDKQRTISTKGLDSRLPRQTLLVFIKKLLEAYISIHSYLALPKCELDSYYSLCWFLK